MFSHFDTIPAYDGQTDGRTDVQPISITCFSIADARKNTIFLEMEPFLSDGKVFGGHLQYLLPKERQFQSCFIMPTTLNVMQWLTVRSLSNAVLLVSSVSSNTMVSHVRLIHTALLHCII